MSELDEVIEAGKLATPRPWFQWTSCGDVSSKPMDCIILRSSWNSCGNDEQADADCKYVVRAANTADKLAEFAKIFAPKLEAVMPCDTDNYGGCDIHLSMPEFLRARELLALFIHGGKDEHD